MKNLFLLLVGVATVGLIQSCGAEDPKKKTPYTPYPGSGGGGMGGSKGSGDAGETSSGGSGGKGGSSAGSKGSGGAAGDPGAGGEAGSGLGGTAGDSAGGAGGDSGDNCPTGFGDCDDDPSNGCEQALNLVTSCGACDTTCSSANGTVECQNLQCVMTSCAAGYGDCDDDGTNGCETSTASNAANCGECGRDCGALGSTCATNICNEIPMQTGLPYGTDNSNARSWALGSTGIFAVGFNSYLVSEMPLNGGARETVWDSMNKTAGTQSIVVMGNEVFWTERGTPSVVFRKDISAAAGVNPTIAWAQPAPAVPAGQTYAPQFLVVQGNAFYFVNGDYQSGDAAGYVFTRAVSAAPATPGTMIVSLNQGTHGAISAFTATSNALYWVTSSAVNAGEFTDEIRTTPLSGGTPTAVPAALGAANTTVYDGFLLPVLKGVGDTLYFVRNVGDSAINGIYRFKTGDSMPTQLVVAENVRSFIVDGQFIYYVQQNILGLFRAPLAGGAGVQISDVNAQVVIGADANFVYVANTSSGSSNLFKVIK